MQHHRNDVREVFSRWGLPSCSVFWEFCEDGGWKMEDEGWRMKNGRVEHERWRVEDEGWRVEDEE